MNQSNTKLHNKAEYKRHCEEPQATKQSRSNAFQRRGFARGDCFAPLAMTVLNNNAELHKEVAVQLQLKFGGKDALCRGSDTVDTRDRQRKDASFSNPHSEFPIPNSRDRPHNAALMPPDVWRVLPYSRPLPWTWGLQ
jgi:hypothetical protein